MKPKTTLNLLKDFFSNKIQKTIPFLTTFFYKKIGGILFEISQILVFVYNSSKSFAESVFFITTLQVEKKRKSKGAPPEEKYYYSMYISNN